MAEKRFLAGVEYWRLSLVRTWRGQNTFGRAKWPILGGALVLLTGCSFFGNQPAPMKSSANTLYHKPVMQAQAPVVPPKWEMTIPDQPSIDLWVKRFSRDKHASVQTQLDRSRYYAVPAREIFERQGLPKDLVFVAMVESGFTPTAISHAKAAGMYQFIPSTGKRFGLEQSQWVDERRHPEKAAKAAGAYLSFLYDTFGSWPLALAAYNAGEKAVQRAIDQSGYKTFWELADHGYLPSETRDYVPKVYATIKIIRDPAQYGFQYDENRYVQRTDTVHIPGGVKLSWVSKKIGVPASSLQDCNPELCQPITPPGCSDYELCVPAGKGGDVLSALAEGPPKEEPREVKAVVASSNTITASVKARPGDSWVSLARKYKTSPKTLAALNHKSLSQPIKAGQTVKISTRQAPVAVASVSKKKNGGSAAVAAAPGKWKVSSVQKKPVQHVSYPVREGDTLWSISRKFGVSVKALCAQNELKPNQKLVPGSRLAIYAQGQEPAPKRRSY